ncbi:Hypothetical protein NTJ_09204 [Nesidiocoris tenuis]|uniref:Gustatory receptor n=1 Tax=Nesidiocoris tenuis TaxID=355587 RepID=A0ABN7AWK9_9HEMI|nr:Hypothetical protein NTJ_09204 [Nesidiocoris tenuis]
MSKKLKLPASDKKRNWHFDGLIKNRRIFYGEKWNLILDMAFLLFNFAWYYSVAGTFVLKTTSPKLTDLVNKVLPFVAISVPLGSLLSTVLKMEEHAQFNNVIKVLQLKKSFPSASKKLKISLAAALLIEFISATYSSALSIESFGYDSLNRFFATTHRLYLFIKCSSYAKYVNYLGNCFRDLNKSLSGALSENRLVLLLAQYSNLNKVAVACKNCYEIIFILIIIGYAFDLILQFYFISINIQTNDLPGLLYESHVLFVASGTVLLLIDACDFASQKVARLFMLL